MLTPPLNMLARRETQLARNNFLSKITFADEQRHNEHAPGKDAPHHARQIRFLLPKSLLHLRENLAPPQFLRMLVCRRARFRIQRRTMSNQNERRIRKVFCH